MILIAGLVVVISLQRDDFSLSRSLVINAPATNIFPLVNEKRKWLAWSPWVRLDPSTHYTYEGPEAGIGAVTKWAGNNKVGTGTSTITDSRTDEYIKLRLDFEKPMRATNIAVFTFHPQGNQKLAKWAMSGNNNFVGKAFTLLMNCNHMIGHQFDLGLANLKMLVEAN